MPRSVLVESSNQGGHFLLPFIKLLLKFFFASELFVIKLFINVTNWLVAFVILRLPKV